MVVFNFLNPFVIILFSVNYTLLDRGAVISKTGKTAVAIETKPSLSNGLLVLLVSLKLMVATLAMHMGRVAH